MSFLDKILESSDVDEKAVSDMQQSLQSDLFTSQVRAGCLKLSNRKLLLITCLAFTNVCIQNEFTTKMNSSRKQRA